MPIDEEWLGDEMLANVRAGIEEGLREGGDIILTESNLDSPTLTGDMDSTGHVEVAGNEAGVGYDHPGVRKQHENTWYAHPQGDKPKFLENAVSTKADDVFEALATSIGKAIGA